MACIGKKKAVLLLIIITVMVLFLELLLINVQLYTIHIRAKNIIRVK